MACVVYTKDKAGNKIGRWSGKSYRDENGKPQKTGQMYLAKVIDEELDLFQEESWLPSMNKHCFFEKHISYVRGPLSVNAVSSLIARDARIPVIFPSQR